MELFKKSKALDAARVGDTKRLGELLDAGVSPDAKKSGDTLLWISIEHNRPESVKLLLERGAKAGLEFNVGWTVLHKAASMGNVGIAALLLEKNPALLHATSRKQKNTALHLAAESGHVEFVADMLKRGLDPQQKNVDGHTALTLARFKNQSGVVELLKPLMPGYVPPAPPAPPPAEGWNKLSGEKIAHVAVETAIGYRLTEIFDFRSRERIRIVHNLETKRDQMETTPFDSITDQKTLQDAFNALTERGGTADASSIHGGLSKPAKLPPPAGSQ